MRIGFIGLGRMGGGMARSLIKAGHEVTVWNRARDKAEGLGREGARIAAGLSELAGCDPVITMVADDAATEALVLGADGLVAVMRPGSTHVAMSTISVALSERLSRAHAQAKQGYVAAPVFGRPESAAAAKLFVVVAAPAREIEKCRPAFDAIGQRTFVVSESPADANLVKLSGNFMIGSVIEALGETVALMRKAGIDPGRYLEIMTNTLFAAPVYKTYGDLIAAEKYQPAGFKAPLGLKDIGLVLAAAGAQRVPMPVASLKRDRLIGLIAQEGEDIDWSAIALIAARNAGL
jgi:3-hydroxyisobutyrate dehydrogenase-like beta-hydroxyacid dehydrogenase